MKSVNGTEKSKAGGVDRGADPPILLKSVGFLLAVLGAESRRRFVEGLAAHDLRLSHYAALMTLGNSGPMTQEQLASAIGIDPRNAVSLIGALQVRGYIERLLDPSNRRRYIIKLSRAGKRKLTNLEHDGREIETRMLADLNVREREELLVLLARLHGSVFRKSRQPPAET